MSRRLPAAVRAGAGLALLLAVACEGDPPAPRTAFVPGDGPRQLVDPEAGFFGLPFPDNTRPAAAGRLDTDAFPNPASLTVLDTYLGAISEHWTGYGTSAAMYLRFAHAPAGDADLPTAAATRTNEGGILLVDIDPDSPEFGRRRPLDLRWHPRGDRYLPPGTLSARPVSGFVLRPGTTYALVVYPSFAGWGLRTADWWRQRRQAADAAGLIELVEAEHIPASPAAGLIFTTGDPVGGLAGAAAEIAADPQYPRLVTWSAMAPVGACRRVEASVDLLNFQHGTKPYLTQGGGWRPGPEGRPAIAGTDRVRVVLSVPDAPMPATGWPVLLMAHGTGSDAESWSRTRCTDPDHAYCAAPWIDAERTECYCATVLCAGGVASVAFEQPLHGDRLPADAELDASVLTFNLFNPVAIRDNLRQGAADLISLDRWLRELHVPADTFPLGVTFRADPDRFLFMGHSQGTNTGVPFLALKGRAFQAAVLSGASGGLDLALVHKTAPVHLPGLLEAGLSSYGSYSVHHPALSLFQSFAEPADTLNYGRFLLTEPLTDPTGWRPLHLFVSEGVEDRYTPPVQLEALTTTLELAWLEPQRRAVPQYELLERPLQSRPVAGNLAHGGESYTAVHIQYPQGHFSLFEDPGGGRAFTRFLLDAASGRIPSVAPR